MPENTFIYDTVWEEFREELQLTYDEMCEAIMYGEAMLKQSAQWKMEDILAEVA